MLRVDMRVDILRVDILSVDILRVDMRVDMRVDILSVDMRVDILRLILEVRTWSVSSCWFRRCIFLATRSNLAALISASESF